MRLGAMSLGNGVRAILARSRMPSPDYILQRSQRDGHVSEEAVRLADKIYDPVHDPDGRKGVVKLRKVVARSRKLQTRKSARYAQRRAAAKARGRRTVR